MDLPKGADLANLIKLENKKQNLGQFEGKLKVPSITLDSKIFLQTALIRRAYEPQIFAYPGQNKTIQMLKRYNWWEGMVKDIKWYIKNC